MKKSLFMFFRFFLKGNFFRKKIKFSVPEREEDDLEFADEIDYPPDVLLKE